MVNLLSASTQSPDEHNHLALDRVSGMQINGLTGNMDRYTQINLLMGKTLMCKSIWH
jgi:hypothetical protein